MSSNKETATSVSVVAPPTDIDKHNADLKRRRDEHDAKRGVLLDCLDASIAAEHEAKKTVWEWTVKAELFRPTKGRVKAHMEKVEKSVVAQHEQDAWAMFCDSIGEWPSRRDSKVIITRGKKRTLRGDDRE